MLEGDNRNGKRESRSEKEDLGVWELEVREQDTVLTSLLGVLIQKVLGVGLHLPKKMS